MAENRSFPGANVRSQTYLVARTSVRCPHCGLPTRLLALAMPRNHETLDEDAQNESEDGPEPSPDAWQRESAAAFLFYVERLPEEVQDRLKSLSPLFRPAPDSATLNSYWANHCENCGRFLADHELHCEPGAFMASSAMDAATIELVRIPEPFSAVAAGYAAEPEFFDCMRLS